MSIVTIACPVNLDHIEIDKNSAPIWIDSVNNEYYIVSGLLTGLEETEEKLAAKDRITIIIGPPGSEALAIMGLVPKLI